MRSSSMKRLVLVFLIMLPLATYGQFDFGVKLGVNASGLIDESSKGNTHFPMEYSTKLSLNGGLIMNYDLAEKLDLSAELLYTSKGGNGINTRNQNSFRQSYQYLSLNYLAIFDFRQKLQLLGLLETGLMLKDVYKEGGEERFENSSLVKPFDIAIGAGLRYPILNKFSAEVRYSISANRVINEEFFFTDDGTTGFTEYFRLRNHVLQLNFIYMFSKN